MRIYIDVDDKVMRDAVTSQIGIELAKFANEQIPKMMDNILQTKLDRFHPHEVAENHVKKLLDIAVKRELENIFGNQPRAYVKQILSDAALSVVKENMRR